jgi:hypothetical protein
MISKFKVKRKYISSKSYYCDRTLWFGW